jgi:hypothetical protein
MTEENTKLRLVVPRRDVLMAGLASVGALAAGRARAQEGGEGGEGAILDALPPEIEFLVSLYLFDATYRIVGALHAGGHTDEAAEQLEFSHHAHYEDIAEGVAELTGSFEGDVTALRALLDDGAGPDAVTAALDTILADDAEVSARFEPGYRMQAIESLVRVAALDYGGGVADDGEILSGHEYRDAWGFVQTARAELAVLAASDDATVAGAAERALTALEPADALFDGLMAQTAPNADASVLHGAAARIEIARLRLG